MQLRRNTQDLQRTHHSRGGTSRTANMPSEQSASRHRIVHDRDMESARWKGAAANKFSSSHSTIDHPLAKCSSCHQYALSAGTPFPSLYSARNPVGSDLLIFSRFSRRFGLGQKMHRSLHVVACLEAAVGLEALKSMLGNLALNGLSKMTQCETPKNDFITIGSNRKHRCSYLVSRI